MNLVLFATQVSSVSGAVLSVENLVQDVSFLKFDSISVEVVVSNTGLFTAAADVMCSEMYVFPHEEAVPQESGYK